MWISAGGMHLARAREQEPCRSPQPLPTPRHLEGLRCGLGVMKDRFASFSLWKTRYWRARFRHVCRLCGAFRLAPRLDTLSLLRGFDAHTACHKQNFPGGRDRVYAK